MYRWIICGVYSMGILLLSLMPSKTLNHLLKDIGLPHSDKVFHFLMYGVLAGLVMWALRVNTLGYSVVLKVVAGCFLYGALMETLQLIIIPRDRHFSWGDMLANGLGAGTAVVLYMMLKRGTRKTSASVLTQ
jgi:VanZ family protein